MKKVVVISPRRGSDWSMDLLWAGLVRTFGGLHVIDFPRQERHHRREVRSLDRVEQYGLERSSLCYTGYDSDEQVDVPALVRAGQVGHIFMNELDEAYEWYLRLRADKFDIPVTVVAGHDRFWNISPQFVAGRYGQKLRCMFLDNWRFEYDLLPYARVTNFSTNFDHLWDSARREQLLADKVYDVCFFGYNSHPDRERFVRYVERNFGQMNNAIMLEVTPDRMDDFVLRREYMETMARSRVCLSLRGAAEDGKSLRYYEIPYVGSFMVAQRFPAKLVSPFVDRVHCRYFSDEAELKRILICALQYDEKREEMAQRGHRHAMEHHTSEARVRQMVEQIGGLSL